MAANGMIPPHSLEHMEISCPLFESGKVIHPFAYRVHTHELGMFVVINVLKNRTQKLNNVCLLLTVYIGKVVAGYRVKTFHSGGQTWDLLGKRDPLTPQMFYPVENNVTVGFGDRLVSNQ